MSAPSEQAEQTYEAVDSLISSARASGWRQSLTRICEEPRGALDEALARAEEGGLVLGVGSAACEGTVSTAHTRTVADKLTK